MLKFAILSLLATVTPSNCLRMQDTKDKCDRTGVIAEKKLRQKYVELGLSPDITIFDAMEMEKSGQYFYTNYAWTNQTCTDNWGYHAEGNVLNFPEPQQNANSGAPECHYPLMDQLGLSMYHFMATDGVDVAGKTVVEVSCGKGKGAAYVAQNLKPKKYTGIDLNMHRISLANKWWSDTPNLNLILGNAQAMPFADNSVDVVLNVEASPHYPDFDGFIGEVHRVLKKGGMFSWTSPLINGPQAGDTMDSKQKAFIKAGFKLVKVMDITPNVMKSRTTHLEEAGPEEHGLMCDWLDNTDSEWGWDALPGSPAFKGMENKDYPYIRFVAQKP